jgi:hypothetical protein
MPVVEAEHVALEQGVRGVEERPVAQARSEVGAGEQEERGLAGRQEAGVREPGEPAELGEAAVERAVLDEQHVERVRLHVRHEAEEEHQPLRRPESEAAHQVGIGHGARGERRQIRRRERQGIALPVLPDMPPQPPVEHGAEPGDLALDAGGVQGVAVHTSPAHVEGRGHETVEDHGVAPRDLVDQHVQGLPLHGELPAVLAAMELALAL